VPDPSSEKSAWWDTLDIASIQQAVEEGSKKLSGKTTNPFEQNYLTESTTPMGKSQGEAKVAPALSIKRKPPPPNPSSKPGIASPARIKPPVDLSSKPKIQEVDASGSTAAAGKTEQRSVTSSTTGTSLMDSQDEEMMRRPGLKVREVTNDWQVITPSAMKR